MGEVSMLSMERDELNDKVTEYEEKIKVRQYNTYLLHNAYVIIQYIHLWPSLHNQPHEHIKIANFALW